MLRSSPRACDRLRPPYSDIMKGGSKKDDRKDSDEPMSWDQVVALTHKENVSLRPTLSDDMDAAILALIRSCWADDPELRPSFSVILVRLDATKRRNAMRLKEEEAEEEDATRPPGLSPAESMVLVLVLLEEDEEEAGAAVAVGTRMPFSMRWSKRPVSVNW